MASESDPAVLTEKLAPSDAAQVQEKLDEVVEYAIAGGRIQERAEQTRKRAKEASNARERAALEQEADELDEQAKEQLKTTQRLQSGVWQGFGAGAGIGASSGLAVGTATGVLVGGVLAVPTTLLGGLIGAGTGALHGPWIKLTRGDKGLKLDKAEPDEPGAVQLKPDDIKPPQEAMDVFTKNQSKGKEMLGQGFQALRNRSGSGKKPKGIPSKSTSTPPKRPIRQKKPGQKPPRKLEIRSESKPKQNK